MFRNRFYLRNVVFFVFHTDGVEAKQATETSGIADVNRADVAFFTQLVGKPVVLLDDRGVLEIFIHVDMGLLTHQIEDEIKHNLVGRRTIAINKSESYSPLLTLVFLFKLLGLRMRGDMSVVAGALPDFAK